MNILATNDDGIDSPGLQALVSALANAGHSVTVIAPDRCYSATSMSLTIRGALTLTEQPYTDATQAYKVTGTTVDCVKLGISGLGLPVPELVVSGINLGLNLARDLHYSATVGGATEACLSGFKAIALSAEYGLDQSPRVDDGARVLIQEWSTILDRLENGHFANINVPLEPYKAICYTRISREPVFHDKYTREGDQFELAGTRDERFRDRHEDLGAINDGCASISFARPGFD